MTDRPIIFSAPMVRALLDGRKTQTRRVLSAQNADFGSAPREYWDHGNFAEAWPDGKDWSGMYLHVPCHSQEDEGRNHVGVDCRRCAEMGWDTTVHRLYPKVRPGDRLWVRERFSLIEGGPILDAAGGTEDFVEPRVDYAADCDPRRDLRGLGYRPSIHMPRWASRLTLIVESVRVERLQEISEADALAEGICEVAQPDKDGMRHFGLPGAAGSLPTAALAFFDLWAAINGAESCRANPWVAAIGFRVVKANIDALERAA